MNANILIVDDSSLARRTVRSMLEELGHSVEEAPDGATALERYFLMRHDLVFLDMVMHGMYGLDVLSKLKELNPQVQVIVVTADIQKSTQAQVRAAGAAAFINKPIAKGAAAAIVTAVLEGTYIWN